MYCSRGDWWQVTSSSHIDYNGHLHIGVSVYLNHWNSTNKLVTVHLYMINNSLTFITFILGGDNAFIFNGYVHTLPFWPHIIHVWIHFLKSKFGKRKSYFNIFFLLFMCIVITVGNWNQFKSSGRNSTKS